MNSSHTLKLILTLTILVLGVSLFFNAQNYLQVATTNDQTSEQSQAQEVESSTNKLWEFSASTSQASYYQNWYAEELPGESDNTSAIQVYRLDQAGVKSSILSRKLDVPFSNIDWQFLNRGRDLMLSIYTGGPEGGTKEVVSFQDGKQGTRIELNQFWGFTQDLNFQYFNSEEKYHIELALSEQCPVTEPLSTFEQYPQTSLTGVTVTSDSFTKEFPLKQPVLINCVTLDASIVNPEPNFVTFPGVNSVRFSLPTGDIAYLDLGAKPEDISLDLRPVDFDYSSN